jgi:hypothetical protein
MDIGELLVTVLRARFEGAIVERSRVGEVQVRFPAVHAAVGDAVAAVESGDVTVYSGCYHLEPPDRTPEAIVDSVERFLETLFADRVLLWREALGGGFSVLRPGETPGPRGDQSFLWSGPLVA